LLPHRQGSILTRSRGFGKGGRTFRSLLGSVSGLFPSPEGLVIVLVFLAALCPIQDADLFLHLATGRLVLEKGVPAMDPFSHTMAGQPWLAHEWFMATLLELGYRVGGIGFLVWCKAMLASVVLFLFIALYHQAGVSSRLASTAGLIAVSVTYRNVLLVRPHLLTLLFVPLILFLLKWAFPTEAEGHRALEEISPEGKGRRLLVACVTPLVFLIWANSHGGYILGFLPFVVVGIDQLRDRYNGCPGASARLAQIGLVGLASIGAVLINPHGIKILSFPFLFDPRASFLSLVDEWAPPDFKRFVPHELVLLALIVAPLVWPVRATWGEIVGLLAGLHLGLTAIRNQFLIGVFGSPIVARCLDVGTKGDSLLARVERRFELASRNHSALLPFVLVAAASLPWSLKTDFVEASRYPKSAVEWLRRDKPPGALFNEYGHGGYLLWALPEYPVFIDGRIEIYSRQRVLPDYLKVIEARPGWAEVLDRRGVNLVLIRKEEPLVSALARDSRFFLAFDKDGVAGFIRRNKTKPLTRAISPERF